ncbi:hypothetical protein [Fructilactobacillus lindneri]|uniref:hypothetical protein n=1 Tax=Fructilactobacillus lindneri TaxID=53444 RepID=UPI000CD3BD43|nr:hypothetical protein [Fructilactobacillus lindneri]POH04605.1 hypothetical protein BGL33_06860 [Fructilactobacillus lindneri]
MAIDYVTARNTNTGDALYFRTAWKMIDDTPNFVTSDDLNGATSSWSGVTTNIQLGPGSSIKWRIQNNILYIVGGGILAEDPKGEIFFTIPGIAGRVAETFLYAWNAADGTWNRSLLLKTDGNVTQWNCANKMVFSINAAIPLDGE